MQLFPLWVAASFLKNLIKTHIPYCNNNLRRVISTDNIFFTLVNNTWMYYSGLFSCIAMVTGLEENLLEWKKYQKNRSDLIHVLIIMLSKYKFTYLF